jgi:hypothetical protein
MHICFLLGKTEGYRLLEDSKHRFKGNIRNGFKDMRNVDWLYLVQDKSFALAFTNVFVKLRTIQV